MKFLSPEWVDQLDQQLKASRLHLPSASEDNPNPISSLCVQNIVELPDQQPDLRYAITIDATGATATAGQVQNPNVTFTQSWSVATAIAQKKRDAHAAFLMGEIKVSGDVSELMNLGDAAAQIQAVITELNDNTEFGTD